MIVGATLNRLTVTSKCSIREVIKVIDDGALQVALVVDSTHNLLGIVTDGDIRRGLLQNISLDGSVELIMKRQPIVAFQTASMTDVVELMELHKIHQIPILDAQSKLLGLYIWNVTHKVVKNNFFVIMAGGLGTRLMPFTKDCPKPMLLVKGKPILERIIIRAREQGFKNFLISVNYLSHIIQDYFGDGAKFDVNISYIEEKSRLGTIGALSLSCGKLIEPFIVTNGDVLTDINYSHLLKFHSRNEFLGTMAVRSHEIQNPYGVVNVDGHRLVGFEEKPIYRSYINTGVYALSQEVLSFLDVGEYCDAPTLFGRISESNPDKSCVYLMQDEWLDIGRPEDFNAANQSPADF